MYTEISLQTLPQWNNANSLSTPYEKPATLLNMLLRFHLPLEIITRHNVKIACSRWVKMIHSRNSSSSMAKSFFPSHPFQSIVSYYYSGLYSSSISSSMWLLHDSFSAIASRRLHLTYFHGGSERWNNVIVVQCKLYSTWAQHTMLSTSSLLRFFMNHLHIYWRYSGGMKTRVEECKKIQLNWSFDTTTMFHRYQLHVDGESIKRFAFDY